MDPDSYNTLCCLTGSITLGRLDGSLLLSLAIMVLLLFISGFVSGSEVAYFSLSPGNIEKLNKERGRLNKMTLSLLSLPDRLLATILITNNFVNVGIVILSSYIMNTLFIFSSPPWVAFLIQVVAITSLILFCSEIFPKIYANKYSLSYARLTAPGLTFFSKIIWPISTFLIYSTSIVNKRLVKHSGNLSIDDLSNALELTEPDLPDEKSILKGIVKFGNIDVCEIMRSRVDVVAVDFEIMFNELLKVINDSGFSRIPVYENSFDELKGILYIKDLLPHLNKPADFKWQTLLRPPYFIPESKKINDLLKEFQENRIHMAVVVDEYGGSSGIVTLEDILEEIVGEITDESDIEKLPYVKIDEKTFIFEGKVLLNDLYKILRIEDEIFDSVKGDADTLAGLILELRGEFPQKDDKLAFKNLAFTITEVDNRRIKKIKIVVRPISK